MFAQNETIQVRSQIWLSSQHVSLFCESVLKSTVDVTRSDKQCATTFKRTAISASQIWLAVTDTVLSLLRLKLPVLHQQHSFAAMLLTTSYQQLKTNNISYLPVETSRRSCRYT